MLATLARTARELCAAPPRRPAPRRATTPSRSTGFLDRRAFRVLDPACGSGNFLYLACRRSRTSSTAPTSRPRRSACPRASRGSAPRQLLGIEINPYAAELARVSVWIGEIQWMQRNGFGIAAEPDPPPARHHRMPRRHPEPGRHRADWPAADVIIGNPPFLGGKLMRDASASLRGRAVCAPGRPVSAPRPISSAIGSPRPASKLRRAVPRAGSSRPTRSAAAPTARSSSDPRSAACIFDAWDDEAWIIEGAAVRVSLVCFGRRSGPRRRTWTAAEVGEDLPDLTARRGRGVDLTKGRGCENAASPSWATPRAAPSTSPGTRPGMAARPLNPERPPEQRCAAALGERSRCHAPARGHVDHRLRLADERGEAAFDEAPSPMLNALPEREHEQARDSTARFLVAACRATARNVGRLGQMPRFMRHPVAKHRLFFGCKPGVPDAS